jgi:hypothetical protein
MRGGRGMGMISVKDRLPDAIGFVWVKRALRDGVELAYFTFGKQFQYPEIVGDSEGLGAEYFDDVTHWQELEPPEDELVNMLARIESCWPDNPYPEKIFPMDMDRYVKAVSDPVLRTAISGCIGRWVWDVASAAIGKAIGNEFGIEGLQFSRDTEVEVSARLVWQEAVGRTLAVYNDAYGKEVLDYLLAEVRAIAEGHSRESS